jgi:aryl-alcohol dehydrogenase-like predicted oxidoreductase
VSPVALGCWPIAGLTTLGTNDADSIDTIQKCFELGINHLDTAFVYGPNGESENLIRRALAGTRGGRSRRDVRRLGTDRVELLYLHAPDDKVPIDVSAAVLRDLMERGKTRAIGVSNFTVEQLESFQAICPISAVQMPYNMLQRDIEQRIIGTHRRRTSGQLDHQPARHHVGALWRQASLSD